LGFLGLLGVKAMQVKMPTPGLSHMSARRLPFRAIHRAPRLTSADDENTYYKRIAHGSRLTSSTPETFSSEIRIQRELRARIIDVTCACDPTHEQTGYHRVIVRSRQERLLAALLSRLFERPRRSLGGSHRLGWGQLSSARSVGTSA
jgi:hypothetical protein